MFPIESYRIWTLEICILIDSEYLYLISNFGEWPNRIITNTIDKHGSFNVKDKRDSFGASPTSGGLPSLLQSQTTYYIIYKYICVEHTEKGLTANEILDFDNVFTNKDSILIDF